jgi:hypothetical protein
MTTIRFTGRVTLDSTILRCPGRGPGDIPRQLTVLPTGSTVSATCGQKHRGPDGGRKAGCFWVIEGLTPAALQGLAQAKPGKIRATLPGGHVLEGRLTAVQASAAKGGKAPAAAAHADKNRKGKPDPHAARSNSGGGAAKAAFMAVAAVAGAVGQTATAASNAVSSTAGMVGTVAKAGASTTQAAIGAADNAGARRHTRRVLSAKPDYNAED